MSKSGSSDACEDGFFINDRFIAVIDGATAKGTVLWQNGRTSGRQARDTLIDAMPKIPVESDAFECLSFLNDALRSEYDRQKRKTLDFSERLEASIIVYSSYKNEIWSYGDCQMMVNDTKYAKEKKIDTICKEARAAFIKALIQSGKATYEQLLEKDMGRDFILPLLKIQSAFSNKNDVLGYPVLNGIDPINEGLIEKTAIRVGDEIVLASDGYPYLHHSLAESEKSLAEVLDADPLLIDRYKSTKGLKKGNFSFDDRCYVRFAI
jgi:hypothetical protein